MIELQRKIAAFSVLVAAIAGVGCERSSTTTAASTKPADTIVSLSPAATDLLLAMDFSDRIVGVSTYDSDPRVAGLPRVGDYENVDWERISTLAPKHMIVQMTPDRLPSGFVERSKKLGIDLINIHIDRLPDIALAAHELGEGLGRPEAADRFTVDAENAFKATAERVKLLPPVRTLIMVSDDGLGLAGRGTYLDDLLIAAGGENALVSSQGVWVKLDREAILTLAPDAIVQLVPAPTAAQREAMERVPMMLAGTPAVKNNRVLAIEEPWALMPGSHVVELADRVAKFLHP